MYVGFFKYYTLIPHLNKQRCPPPIIQCIHSSFGLYRDSDREFFLISRASELINPDAPYHAWKIQWRKGVENYTNVRINGRRGSIVRVNVPPNPITQNVFVNKRTQVHGLSTVCVQLASERYFYSGRRRRRDTLLRAATGCADVPPPSPGLRPLLLLPPPPLLLPPSSSPSPPPPPPPLRLPLFRWSIIFGTARPRPLRSARAFTAAAAARHH